MEKFENFGQPLEFEDKYFTLINQELSNELSGPPSKESVIEAIENIEEFADLTTKQKDEFAEAFLYQIAQVEQDADRAAGDPEN